MARPGHGGSSSWTGGNNAGEGISAGADSPPPSLCRFLSISPPADSVALGLYQYEGWGQTGVPSPHGCQVAPQLSGKNPTRQLQTHSSSRVLSPLGLICCNRGRWCNYPGQLIRAPIGLAWRPEPLRRGTGTLQMLEWGFGAGGNGHARGCR